MSFTPRISQSSRYSHGVSPPTRETKEREREEGETDRYKNTQSSRRGGTNHDPAHHHIVQNVFHLVHQPIKSVLTLYHHLQGKEKRERRNRSSQNNRGYKNTQLSLFGTIGCSCNPSYFGTFVADDGTFKTNLHNLRCMLSISQLFPAWNSHNWHPDSRMGVIGASKSMHITNGSGRFM